MRRFPVYLAGFFLYASLAVAVYVNSSFLNTFISKRGVGWIYIASAAASLLALFSVAGLIRRRRLVSLILVLAVMSTAAAVTMAFHFSALVTLLAFVVFYLGGFLLSFSLDIYLESLSDNENTGEIRGRFLTIANLAFLISPLIAGFLIGNNRFWLIYLASAVFLFLILFVVKSRFEEPQQTIDPWPNLKRGLNKNIYRILGIDLILNFFYAWMVIYMPIYLNQEIGFTWLQIGLIFTVMLLPFVLLTLPLGKIADRWLGEKEILSFGLAIAAVATLIIPYVKSTNLLPWMAILFLTRVGASAIEIMKDTYLFKKIDYDQTIVVALSRNTRPLAYLVAPVLANVVLLLLPFSSLFSVLSIVLLLGLPLATRLVDTK